VAAASVSPFGVDLTRTLFEHGAAPVLERMLTLQLGVAALLRAQAPADSMLSRARVPLEQLPVVARIDLPSSADWIAFGFGSVWVVNYRPDRVSRIDVATNRVVADIPIGRNGCLGIVATADRVWVPTCGDGVVNEIDPTSNSVVRRVPVPIKRGREGAFAIVDGSLWIPDNSSDSTSSAVVRIDPSTNRIVASVPVGESPKFMAAGEGGTWVQNRADGSVSRIDPVTNRETARIAAHAPTRAGDISAGGGAVWLSVDGMPVTRIDPRTNTVTHQYVGGGGADAVRWGAGALWVADHKIGQLWRIDAGRMTPR